MKTTTAQKEKKKRKLAFPETALLLFLIIIFASILTYIMPAGQFDRVIDPSTGREVVVAGTYKPVESNPTTLGTLLSSVYNGLLKAGEVICLLFVTGGSFGIISKTGAINAGLGKLMQKMKGREALMVAILMIAFAICGATFACVEESLLLVLMVVSMVVKMGYDPIVGVSIVIVGLYCGYTAGPLNPFNTGIAQGIAQLPMFSGMGLRLLLMAGATVVGVTVTLAHGKRYKKLGIDNSKLLENYHVEEERPMNKTDVIILLILAVSMAVLVYGVVKYQWYFGETTSVFLAMGILCGLVYRKGNLNQITRDFVAGSCEMATACVFIGLSRAILVIMENGMIMDTLVYYISLPLSHLNSVFASWAMFLSQGIINFFIPSSTGQAVVVMPILAPVGDIVGISRQTVVMAYQCGDGFWNMITPTFSILMAALAIAKVSFIDWFKFAWKIVLGWSIWACVVLAIATAINYV